MPSHKATLTWSRTTPDFAYETYDRDHEWSFPSGRTLAASAAPAFRGHADRVDPEEAFVAALASCHMLTFLALAARKGWTVDAYRDEAEGFLERDDQRRLALTRVILRPQVTFGPGTAPTAEELARLHDAAHHECFLANSVRTRITVEPPAPAPTS